MRNVENKTIHQIDRRWGGIASITVLEDNTTVCLTSWNPYDGHRQTYINVTDEELREIEDHYYYSTIINYQ